MAATTKHLTIAQLARETGINYQRVWRASVSAGGWAGGLTDEEVERLLVVLDRYGKLGVDATATSIRDVTTTSVSGS